MNKKVVYATLSAALFCISLVSYAHLVRADSADHITFPSGITIYSPLEKTYNTKYLTLDLFLYSVGYINSLDPEVSLSYSIDGSINGPVPLAKANSEVHVVINAVAKLSPPPLADGEHTLTLYLYGHNQRTHEPKYVSYVDTVHFTVDTGAPKFTILTPQNNTESFSNEVPLKFTLSEPVEEYSYCLDGNRTSLTAENITLLGLSEGQHTITLSATDKAGNTAETETIHFTVINPIPLSTEGVLAQTQESHIIILTLALFAVCSYLGLYFHFKAKNKK